MLGVHTRLYQRDLLGRQNRVVLNSRPSTTQRIRVHARCVYAIQSLDITTLAAIKRHDRRNRTMRIYGDIIRQSRRSVSRSATRITPRRLSPPTDILAALPILRQSTLRWSRNPRPSAWHDASA